MDSFKRGHLDPAEQYELLHDVGIELLGVAPEGWHEITFKVSSLITGSENDMLVHFENGEVERRRFPHTVISKFVELRTGMYQEGKGTWFSMVYKIVRPGKFTTEFNYDNLAPYELLPDPKSFATDLNYFPRDPENIPDWLQQKLREAETEQD